MEAVKEPQVKETRPALHEDWITVVIGFSIIALFILGGFKTPSYSWKSVQDLSQKIFTLDNLTRLFVQFVICYSCAVIFAIVTRRSLTPILRYFPALFLISVLAMLLAGNSGIKSLNLEAVIFSLAIGLAIGNFFKLPDSLRSALSGETFVKIGLVILGTGVVFGDILQAGSLGLIQTIVVVLSVWYFAFWLCKRFKLDGEVSMMISSAVSICGVSAAIATAGAIQGDSKKLSYVISLVLVTAIPMMIFMPYIANGLGLSEEVSGAWLGGTIDTTGAVVAAGSLVGETALKYSTIVKFSQNVLLGLAAFAISVYWTYTSTGAAKNAPTSLSVLWERFPKFVLGFVAASVVFSFILDPSLIAPAKDGLKSIQTLWFVLAFTSIGLETRFSELFNASNKKPLYAFLLAQTFNILITLLVAYLLFR